MPSLKTSSILPIYKYIHLPTLFHKSQKPLFVARTQHPNLTLTRVRLMARTQLSQWLEPYVKMRPFCLLVLVFVLQGVKCSQKQQKLYDFKTKLHQHSSHFRLLSSSSDVVKVHILMRDVQFVLLVDCGSRHFLIFSVRAPVGCFTQLGMAETRVAWRIVRRRLWVRWRMLP